MKKLVLVLAMFAFLAMPVNADQYGDDTGEVLGEQVEEHPSHEVDAGITDMQLWQVITLTAVAGVTTSALYKFSYRLYIFDR